MKRFFILICSLIFALSSSTANEIGNEETFRTATAADNRANVVVSNTVGATVSFSNDHTYEWEWDSTNNRLRSTNYNIDNSNSITEITITISKLATIQFSYWVSSEFRCDIFEILLDGTQIGSKSGNVTVKQSYKKDYLSVGTHTISLIYSKDSSDPEFDDRAYFSNLKLTVPTVTPDWLYPSSRPTTPFASGSGTVSSPYKIATAQQLANFAYLVNTENGTYGNKYYELSADIDLDKIVQMNWVPIQNFAGSFDGKQHTISGFYFEEQSTTNALASSCGLFLNNSGTIKNVGMINGIIQATGRVGSLVGDTNTGTISHCYNSNSITGSYAGGLCNINRGTIEYCYNTGGVNGTHHEQGGIACDNYGIISSCYNNGNINYHRSLSDSGGDKDDTSGLICAIGWEGSEINNCYGQVQIDDQTHDKLKLIGYERGYLSSEVTVANSSTKTLEQFKSGEVCFLLNGAEQGGTHFYQRINTDTYPLLWGQTSKVYCTGSSFCCKNGDLLSGTFSNTSTSTPSNTYVNNFISYPSSAATCTTPGNIAYWKCKTCGRLYSDANGTNAITSTEITIPALGHVYNNSPSWSWSGYTSATATLTCTRDASHTISATAAGSAITSIITKAATCTTNGTRTYTATVTLDGSTYQGTKTQTISATGHGKTNGYTPTFLWEDNATSPSCTFSLRCMDCNTYVVSSQSLPKGTCGTYGYYSQTAHSDPTCSVSGSTTYRATGKYSASGSQSYTGTNDHTYSISATGNHTYDSNGFCSSCDAYQPAAIDTDGYYKIANAGNLYWFAEQVNSGAGTINGKLIADIIVNSNVLKSDGTLNTGDYRNWTPIGMLVGVSSRPFQGIFDGYSHSISGLYFNDYTNDYAGIFGLASNASIRNLIVRDSYFLSKYAAGGIVASAYDCDISNCVNYSTAGAQLAGGILGVNRNYNVMNIQKCSNYGYIFDPDDFCSIGGICGYLEAYEANSFLRKCSNFGKVKASYSRSYSGGIVGYIGNEDGSAYVEYCYNVGSVSGSLAGAIVGYHYQYVNYCLALSGTASAIAGEIAPYNAYSTGNSFISSFSTGEACYLLNESKDSGTNWYQNLDNGKGIDSYPVTDTSHGQVYAGYAHGGTSVSYSNSSMTVKHTTAATASNYKHDNDYTMTAIWTGYTACSIKEVCSVCGKTETQLAGITSNVTKNATCTTSGTRTHTAKVTTAGGRVYTTTKTETIPALGHSYKYTNNMNGTHKKECSRGDLPATNESHYATSNCSLCGNKPVTNITMSHAVDTLAIGQTRTLTATVAPDDATIKTITWSSNATNVATVTSNGVVTAKAAGSATITAAASDQSGKKTTCVYQIYILGDANANGSVNVADVTTIAGYKNWKAKTITTRPVSFVFAAANANFTDQVIDVADITSTVSIVWNGVSYEARPRLSGAQSFEPTILYADGFTLAPGHEVDVDILVSNPSDCFSAYEFFLDLPDGIHVKSDIDGNAMVRLNTARTNGEAVHAFSGRYTEDGRLYVLCYSASNTMFQGQSGAVATVTLVADPTVMMGSYLMSLSNIVLSGEGDVINAEDQMICFDIASQNGIELICDEYESSCWVFDLQGRVVKVDGRPAVSLELLPEGTYIINGKKVIK